MDENLTHIIVHREHHDTGPYGAGVISDAMAALFNKTGPGMSQVPFFCARSGSRPVGRRSSNIFNRIGSLHRGICPPSPLGSCAVKHGSCIRVAVSPPGWDKDRLAAGGIFVCQPEASNHS